MATIAAGTAAAICEPKMARDYVEVSFELAKRKISETYNDYGGMMMQDEQQLTIYSPLLTQSIYD